jgi:hypothetical protein
VLEDPSDPNRVVPDYDAADQLWAALAANEPIQVTHDQDLTGGVIVAEPEPTEEPVDPTPTADPGATPAPSETAVALPDNIPGQNAAQQTCSAGNVRADG